MANSKDPTVKSENTAIKPIFEVSAEFDHPFMPHLNVNDNAKAQIDNEQTRETSIEKHDLKWKHERDKLSNSAVPFPDYDLSSKEHRSLQSEYQERRTSWEYEYAKIENKHDETKMFIREEGQTLSHEFSARNDMNGMSITNDQFLAEKQNGHEQNNLKEEFAEQSKSKDQQDFAVSNDSLNIGKTL